MPPLTRCPSGAPCLNYSTLHGTPDLDGCFGVCAREQDQEHQRLLQAAEEAAALREENDRLCKVLRAYAMTYCEGWCADFTKPIFFTECGGCLAAAAILPDEE